MVKFFKRFVAKRKAIREQREAALKKRIIEYVRNPISEQEVLLTNRQFIINSAGWLGGDYTAADLKRHVLSRNADLFTPSEYDGFLTEIREQYTKGL